MKTTHALLVAAGVAVLGLSALRSRDGDADLLVKVPASPSPREPGPVAVTDDSSTAPRAPGTEITLETVTPKWALEGQATRLTIAGQNLSRVLRVRVGDRELEGVDVQSATLLTGMFFPSKVGALEIAALGSGEASNALPFHVTPSLHLTKVDPDHGPDDGRRWAVTIKGANFSKDPVNVGSVTFGGVPGTNVHVIDSSTLFVVPPAPPLLPSGERLRGPVDVTLTGVGIGDATLRHSYKFAPIFLDPQDASCAVVASPAFAGSVVTGQFVPMDPSGAVVFGGRKAWVLPSAHLSKPIALEGDFEDLVDGAIADLDGDGLLDIMLLDARPGASRVWVFRNDPETPNARFTAAPGSPFAIANAGRATSMAVGLFDGTALYDLAVTFEGTDTLSVLRGLAGGTFADLGVKASFGAGKRPVRVLCADPSRFSTDPLQCREDQTPAQGLDMGGKGKADLVVALAGSNEVAVLLARPGSQFGGPAAPPIFEIVQVASTGAGTAGPRYLALADLAHRGVLDVVAGNALSSNLSVFRGDGAGGIALVATLSVAGSGTLTGVVVGDYGRERHDYCGEPHPDIVAARGSSISVHAGRGDGTFLEGVSYEAEIPRRRAGAHLVALARDLTYCFVYALDANAGENADVLVSLAKTSGLIPSPVLARYRPPPTPSIWDASGPDPVSRAFYAVAAGKLYRCDAPYEQWVLLDPGFPNVRTVRVDASGLVFAIGSRGDETFVARSEDRGATWTRLTEGLPPPVDRTRGANAVAPDPGVAGRVWLGHSLTGGVTGTILFRSDDHGSTWRPAADGLAGHRLRALALGKAAHVVATDEGIFISQNGGVSWQPFAEGFPDASLKTITCLAGDPSVPGRYYAAAGELVFRREPGEGWARLPSTFLGPLANKGFPLAPTGVRVDPSSSNRILVGTSAGIALSEDGGRRFSQRTVTVDCARFLLDPETPGRVFGFTPSLLLVSDNFGRCWRPIPLEGIPFLDKACMPQ